MGKKWRTNKNSNRKHKRSKTKRMRGGLGINPFARKVTNADIVRYLIKQTPPKPINVQFKNSNNTTPKTVTFDKLDTDLTGELYYDEQNKKIRIKFSVTQDDTLKISGVVDENNVLSVKNKVILKNSKVVFVSDIKNEVREDMINTEKQEKATKEQEEQERQENQIKLQEKKASTPKIIKVNLIDATKKGLLSTDWKAKYDGYELKEEGDRTFTEITVPTKDDNNWNFDFFLICSVLNHDKDDLPENQKIILTQILENDLKKSPLKYTDEKSTEIIFTNPGLIYMAIPGKPETYGGCIIYDMDGNTSSHIQLHTAAEDADINYFDESIGDFKDKLTHPSVIMEEYLQKLFPQFAPPRPESIPEVTTDAAATTTDADVEAVAVTNNAVEAADAVTTEADVEADAVTNNAEAVTEANTVVADTVEADTVEADAPEVVTRVEEQGATEEVLPQDNKIKQSSTKVIPTTTKVIPTTTKVIPTTTKVIPSTNKKNISVSQEPVKVEEIKLEMEKETNENVKPKEQPKKQLDTKINDELNKLILELLI